MVEEALVLPDFIHQLEILPPNEPRDVHLLSGAVPFKDVPISLA